MNVVIFLLIYRFDYLIVYFFDLYGLVFVFCVVSSCFFILVRGELLIGSGEGLLRCICRALVVMGLVVVLIFVYMVGEICRLSGVVVGVCIKLVG